MLSRQRRHGFPALARDVRPIRIGNDVWIGHAATILKGVQIGDRAVIGAHTNPLYSLAREIQRQGLTVVPPQSIIVGAEKLHGFQGELIERVFSTRVFETYGSREFILIGAECDKHAGMHLTQENLLVEILDEDSTPTPAGQAGNIVITDLFNMAMHSSATILAIVQLRDSVPVNVVAVSPYLQKL